VAIIYYISGNRTKRKRRLESFHARSYFRTVILRTHEVGVLYLLTTHADIATRVGEFELGLKPDALTFTLLMEESWQQELAQAGIV